MISPDFDDSVNVLKDSSGDIVDEFFSVNKWFSILHTKIMVSIYLI